MFDVCIIGCGVVGALTARELTRCNLKVCIVEKQSDVAMGASRANSGIVHAGFDAKEGTLKARFNVRGSNMMKQVCGELGVKYRNNGSLVLGFNDEDTQSLKELYERGIQNGVEGLQLLSADEARKIEGNLNDKVTAALYAPTGAIVCPYGLTIAACGNAMDNGAQLLLDFEVNAIVNTGRGYTVKACDGREVAARYIVNSAGVHSDEIARMYGVKDISVTARAGEYMLLDKECADLCSCTIFQVPSRLGKGVLVSPTADGNIILGPTSIERNDKSDVSTTKEGLEEIISKTGLSVKNIPYRNVITSFAGLRAVGNTGDFIIKCDNNIVTLCGIESPGLTSAPAIAEYVAELLKNAGLQMTEKEDFNPYRASVHEFADLSLEKKNEVIKQNPDFGKIICRCERISLGEILQALRQNPKARDLDGVKRRTRSGMGRCQGGFCSPAITEIIAKERRTDICEVTKSGKGGYINVGRIKEDLQ